MNEPTASLVERCPTCHHRAMFHSAAGGCTWWMSYLDGRRTPEQCPCTTTRTQLLTEVKT